MARRQGKTPRHLFATLMVSFGLAATAGAAPLRLSLDGLATPGPSVERVEPAPPATGPGGSPDADEELSFVAAPDLQFPVVAAAAGPADDEWLQAARSQQDDGAASTERRLGDFAPPVPPVLVERADPIDQVTLGAARPSPAASEAPKPFTFALGGAAVGWLAAGLALSLGMVAAWQGTHRKRARRAAPAPAGAAA